MISPQSNYITSNIIYIRGGLEGAKNYPVNPGFTAMLLDEENKKFFIKVVNNGIPTIREFDYDEKNLNMQASSEESSKYVTKEEFESLKQEIQKLSEKRNYYKHNNYRRNGNGKSYGKSV